MKIARHCSRERQFRMASERTPLLDQKDDRLEGNVVRIVLIGDQRVGKTSLIRVYMTSMFSPEYEPTIYDNHETTILHRKKPIMVMVSDTGADQRSEQTRVLSYMNASIVIVCFAVDSLDSFNNVKNRWVPEVRQHNTSVPILLVGTKSDLTLPMNDPQGSPVRRPSHVTEMRSSKLAADLGLCGCHYTSAAFNDQVREVFAQAISVVANNQLPKKKKICSCCPCL